MTYIMSLIDDDNLEHLHELDAMLWIQWYDNNRALGHSKLLDTDFITQFILEKYPAITNIVWETDIKRRHGLAIRIAELHFQSEEHMVMCLLQLS